MFSCLTELNYLKMNPGESVAQFMGRSDILKAKLDSFPATKDYDMWLATKVIAVLPESFAKAKTVLNIVPILSNWENFKLILLHHDKIERAKQQAENNAENNELQKENAEIDEAVSEQNQHDI